MLSLTGQACVTKSRIAMARGTPDLTPLELSAACPALHVSGFWLPCIVANRPVTRHAEHQPSCCV